MIEHAWSLLCTKCITDSNSKNLTLVDLIEQLNAPAGATFPGVAAYPFDFVTTWYRSNSNQGARGTGRITFEQPDGSSREVVQFAIDLTAFYRAHCVVQAPGMQLVAEGIHFFNVDLRVDGRDWRNVARIPLNVARQAEAAGAAVQVV